MSPASATASDFTGVDFCSFLKVYEISFVADPWKSSQWETTYTSDLDSILMKHEKVYPIEALTYRSRRFKLGERGFVTVLPTIASQAELPSDT